MPRTRRIVEPEPMSPEATRAAIESEGEVALVIPPDPLNRWKTHVEGAVNGVRFRVPVGKMVKVPRAVAEVLVNSDYLGSKLTVETFTDPFEVRRAAAEAAEAPES
ncbi:MAG: hypothetical protein QJR08_03765 [Bacillota bacterium]|nr:hypothetical protein [Bacillota bacterium]